jgi:cell division septum initiation protein DivIVA
VNTSIKVEQILNDLSLQLIEEVKRLQQENEMLTQECNALRQQLRHAEAQVYNGSTM